MRFCPNCNSAVYDDRAALCPEWRQADGSECLPQLRQTAGSRRKSAPCSDCRAHGERYAVRNQSREQKSGSGELSMWAYMGLLLLAMVRFTGTFL